MIGPLAATRNGLRRLSRVRRIVAWLWLANLLFALPLAVLVGGGVSRSIGSSRVGESLLEGLDLVWLSEYHAEVGGAPGTLAPSQVGVGAFLDNLELWFSGGLFEIEPALVTAGLLYALLWALLLGGVLAYLQSGDRPTVRGFFGFGGELFARYVRLALVMAPLYYGLYRFSRWLFGALENATRDVTLERTVLTYYLIAAALVVVLLAALRMMSDYAKIAILLEDRRSSLLAALGGARFIIARPIRSFALVGLVGLAGVILLWVYHLVAPGARQASWSAVVFALLVGQLMLIGRLTLRLTLLGAQLDLYERTSSFGGTVRDD